MSVTNKGKHQQADNRFTQFLRDQHDRTWVASFEPSNRHSGVQAQPAPAESPKPYGWRAPESPKWMGGLLVPPPQYAKVYTDQGPPRIIVDYQTWIADAEERETEYRLFMQRVATDGLMYKHGDLVKILENPPVELLNEAGPPPFPSAMLVQAMADGDEWALGKSKDVPAWIEDELDNLKIVCLKMGLLPAWAKREMSADKFRRQRAEKSAAKQVKKAG